MHGQQNVKTRGSVFLEGLRMTDWVETCRPDIYSVVYEMKVLLLTDVLYLFVCYTAAGWKTTNL